MMKSEHLLSEVTQYVDQAMGGIHTLHLGPLDYNVTTAVDYLQIAAKALEEYGRRNPTITTYEI